MTANNYWHMVTMCAFSLSFRMRLYERMWCSFIITRSNRPSSPYIIVSKVTGLRWLCLFIQL